MILSPQECGCPIIPEGASVTNSPICGQYLFMMLIESYLWGRCAISTPCKRLHSEEPIEQYDFIVVGAGTAGSIVAGRLSENKEHNVLLLEAGGPEPVAARVPSFYRSFWNDKELDWGYHTTPGNYCRDQGDNGCLWMRGKVMGGTSVLNGMMYHRGHAADYEDWATAANSSSWSWDGLQKYFNMSEGNKQIDTLVNGAYHSATGRMPVQRFNYQPPEIHDLLKAVVQTGFPVITDMNDPDTPEGFTIAQAFNDGGQRYTTARAYLTPKSETPNLSVTMHAHVTKVIFNGTRAAGVEFINSKGITKRVKAVKEVILSAGALNSPHILMLSGVGLKKTLENFNITVLADLPVGQNLRNHIGATVYYLLTSLNNSATLDWNGFTEVNTVALLPLSVGYMTLNSTDPLDPPIFYANYFDHPDDMKMVKDGFKILKKLFYAKKELTEKVKIELDTQYTQVCDHLESWSEDWSECIIREHTDPQNHQLGTTALGTVVDAELKVFNLENLRVCDAGTMPTLVTGNPQAAIMAIAEKCADHIKLIWA